MTGARGLLAAFAVDFLARYQRSLDRSKIDLLAVNLPLNSPDEFASELHIPSRVPDFDQRLALPVVGGFCVIAQGVGKADSQLSLIALWPQAQVDAEDRTFRSGAGKNLGHLLCQTNKVFAIRNWGNRRLLAIAEDVQQIDI